MAVSIICKSYFLMNMDNFLQISFYLQECPNADDDCDSEISFKLRYDEDTSEDDDYGDDDRYEYDGGFPDYTACDKDDCRYCGRCDY